MRVELTVRPYDKTWSRLPVEPLGGNRPSSYVLRNFYYSVDPNTGRGRIIAAQRGYRERFRFRAS